MDESAIRLIQNTAFEAAENYQSRLPANTVALPDGVKLHGLEQFQLTRNRFRGVLQTDSLADFIAYVKDNAKDSYEGQAIGFIQSKELAATAFFNLIDDEGAPGHADWKARLKLEKTPALAALLGINGQALKQRELTDWLEDWNANVTSYASENGDAITRGAALAAIRNLKISGKSESTHSDGSMRAAKTAMEEIEASAGPNLPDKIYFRCDPALGLPGREFALRVGVLTSHEDPRFVLRVMELERHQEEIGQDFKRELIGALENSAKLTIGSFTP